jgi:WD40 repeat protein
VRASSLLTLVVACALAVRTTAAPPAAVSLPTSELVAGPAKPIAIAPDGSWIAFVAMGGIGDPERPAGSGRVQVWNLKTGALDRSFIAPGIWLQNEVPVAPNGRWLALPTHVDGKNEVCVYDFRTGKLTCTIRDAGTEYAPVGFSADGKELYTAVPPDNGGKRIIVWSTADGSKVREVPLTQFNRVTVSPDGKTALVGPSRADDNPELWDLATGKKFATLDRDSTWRKPTFLRGGKELALLSLYSLNLDYRVWEVGGDKAPTTIKLTGNVKDPIRSALAHDLSAIAVLEYHGNLRVFDVGKTEPRFTFSMKAPLGEGPLFTPDGKRVIVVHPHERAWVLDATTGKPVFALDPDYRSVKALAFTADGRALVAGAAQWPKATGEGTLHPPDGFLLTWDTSTGELRRAAGPTDNFLSAVHPSPDGARAIIVTAEYSNRAEWWDLQTGKRLKVLCEPADGACYFGGSADGKKVSAIHYVYTPVPGGRSGNPKDVWVWDPTTGERLRDLAVTSSYPARFTPDGRTALVRNYDVGVQAVPTAGGKPVTLWKSSGTVADDRSPEDPVPLPDGESFVAYHTPHQYARRDLYVHDIGRQVKFGTAEVRTGPIAVSPDGKWVAVGGTERDKPNPVYLWKVPELGPLDEKLLAAGKRTTFESLTPRVTLDGHLGEVFAVAFAPDGKTLATGGRDKIIRLWDVRTGKLKASLWAAPPTDPAGAPTEWVAFTPDGAHAGSARGRAFLRFAEGDGAKLHNPEKVRAALGGK